MSSNPLALNVNKKGPEVSKWVTGVGKTITGNNLYIIKQIITKIILYQKYNILINL